jgi:hypothetical protein
LPYPLFRTLIRSVAFLTVAALTPPAAARASAVSAEFNPPSGNNSYGGFGREGSIDSRAQIFLATVGGRVDSVSLRVYRNLESAGALVIAITEADTGGLPTGDPLGSITVPEAEVQLNAYALQTFSFGTAGPVLTAGRKYAIVLTPVTLNPGTAPFGLNGANRANVDYPDGNSAYRFGAGTAWNVSDITNYVFRVTVDQTTPVERTSWGGVKARYGSTPGSPAP